MSYKLVYFPRDEASAAAYEMVHNALGKMPASNGNGPATVSQVRDTVLYSLFERYKGRVTYAGKDAGKVPRRIRKKLLMSRLKGIVKEAVRDNGFGSDGKKELEALVETDGIEPFENHLGDY